MNQLVNNWTYGEMSPKLAGRFDIALYQQGCEALENFLPMKQGGLTRRPPLKHVGVSDDSRLFKFTLSNDISFIIELYADKLSVWGNFDGSFKRAVFIVDALEQDYLTTGYTAMEVWEVQYAQYYDRVYFAHYQHKPLILYYAGSSFSLAPMDITNDADSNFGDTAGAYPGVVSICQNRLWFGATGARPFTLWSSRPYEDFGSHEDFTTIDFATTEVEVMTDIDTWPTKDDGNGNTVYDLSDPDAFVETEVRTEEIITARCAMEIELSSGRNDRIAWIGGMNNIIVGTESSEWLLPYTINPIGQSASMQSAHGSEHVQSVILNNGIFYIQHGNRLREYTAEQPGGSRDHSFSADHILQSGVRQMISVKNPEPMIMFLLNDGTLVVFIYDQMYQIQAWARWATDGEIVSITTRDVSGVGQEIYAVVKRGVDTYLEKFDFSEELHFIDRYGEASNGDLSYVSTMVSNRYDFISEGGVSIGKPKRIREIWVRCLESGRIRAGISENYMQTSKEPVGSDDYRILISGGTRRDMRARIQSVGDEPLTLLAMAYDMEVY